MFPHYQMRRRYRIWKRSTSTVLKRHFPNVPLAGHLDIQNQTLIELNFKRDADVALNLCRQRDTSRVTTSLLFKSPDIRNFEISPTSANRILLCIFGSGRQRPFCQLRIAKVGNSWKSCLNSIRMRGYFKSCDIETFADYRPIFPDVGKDWYTKSNIFEMWRQRPFLK